MKQLASNLLERFTTFGLAEKIYAVAVAFMLLVAVLMSAAIYSVHEQRTFYALLDGSTTANRNVDRANGLIYAIVMESRGIYLSDDHEQTRRYAELLLDRCNDLARIADEWQDLVRTDDEPVFLPFRQRLDQFVAFRRELARRALASGAAAARELGDNEDSRAIRTSLNSSLNQLSGIYAARAYEIGADADASRFGAIMVVVLGAGTIVFAAIGAWLLVRSTLTPLRDIAEATASIAKGRIKLVIPHVRRQDEIGQVARAVEAFQGAGLRIEELEQHEVEIEREHEHIARERDELQEKAHSGQSRLNAAIGNMPQGLVMLDRNGVIQVVNEQYRKIYGVPASVAKPGAHLRDVLTYRAKHGLLRESVDDYYDAVVKRMQSRKPTVNDVDLGDGRVVRVSQRPMDGQGWVSTHEDITEQQRNKRVLARAEHFLLALLENIPQAVVAKDAHSLRYVFVNHATETLFGLPRHDIVGKTPRELFPEPTGALLEQSDRDQLAGLNPQAEKAQTIETPGSGRRDIVVRRLPVSVGEGEPKFLLSIIEDRTREQRAAA